MKIKIILSLVVAVICSAANAQVTSLSPYSRYALGNLNIASGVQLQSMANNFSTYSGTYVINSNNPATYGNVKKPMFDVGFQNSFLTIDNQTEKENKRDGAITGFRFLFPLIANKMGFSFGLMPYSTSGYSIKGTQNVTNIGDVEYLYEGEGGVNEAYLGVGGKLLGSDSLNMMVGVNGMYLFGTSTKNRFAILPSDQNNFNVHAQNKLRISDVSALGSMMVNWLPSSKKDVVLRLGGTFALGGAVSGTQTELTRTYVLSTLGTRFYRDTIQFVDQGEGQINLPARVNVGLGGVINKKWYVGLNYGYTDWGQYQENFTENVSYNLLKASTSFCISSEYTPQTERLISNSFWKAANYRFGVRTVNDYLSVDNHQLKINAVSLGIGLPLLKSKSYSTINVGVEVGNRKGNSEVLIQENFVNLFLGMTFVPNRIDNWFVKRKYD